MLNRKVLIIPMIAVFMLAGCTGAQDPEPQTETGGGQETTAETTAEAPAETTAELPPESTEAAPAGTPSELPPPPSSQTGTAAVYHVPDLLTAFGWCGRPAEDLGVHHSYIGDYDIRIDGKLFGGAADGSAYFEVPLTEEKIVDSINLYVYNDDLSAEECLNQLGELFGPSVEQGEEPYAASNGGAVYWEIFDTGIGEVHFAMGSENDWYSLIYSLKEGEVPPDNSGKTGDFNVSNPRWNKINWDADGDGTEEELLFEYEDQGDEAPSFIRITLYDEDGEQEIILDRAYGLNRIFAKEDADGPYLEVYYEMGDYYSHDAEGRCILRLRGGSLILVGESL